MNPVEQLSVVVDVTVVVTEVAVVDVVEVVFGTTTARAELEGPNTPILKTRSSVLVTEVKVSLAYEPVMGVVQTTVYKW